MKHRLSIRSNVAEQSEIRAMTLACTARNGINLSQGVCDTETPDAVLTGACDAIRNGQNSYTRYDGIDELRIEIAKKEMTYKGVMVDPQKEVVVSSGATGAFFTAVMALLDQGDEVVIFEPYYGYHVSTLIAAGISIRYVRLQFPHWSFSSEDLEKAVTPKTRAVIINTPSNPCGKVFSRSELEAIGEIAEKFDLYVISDEIYEYFVYDGLKHLSPIAIDTLKSRTVVVGGFSKTFSITGWRIGYTVAPEEISRIIGQLSDLYYICPPAPLQYGVAAGLSHLTEEHYRKLCHDHLVLRNMLCTALDEAGLTPSIPAGAYYVLADISSVPGKTCKEKVMTILDKTGIAGVPGSAFYHDDYGDSMIRFCFAKKAEIISDACNKLLKLKN